MKVADNEQWIDEQFGHCDFNDPRRTLRLRKVATQLLAAPEGTLPQQNSNWADLKAAYRLLDRKEVTFEKMAQPHWEKTRQTKPGRYLLISDTTDINKTSHKATKGLGILGDREGLADNTLVVFVVDNGYVQLPGINWFHKRSKLSPYEAGIRTPILLRWPGRIRPARFDMPVHTIDLVPTVLAACSMSPPDDLPGINLLKICDGQPPQRDAIYGATFRHKSTKGIRPTEPDDTVDYRWCLADRWKLIVPRAADTPPLLFDVLADPHEEQDLAAEHSRRVRELKTKIDQWWSPVVDSTEDTAREAPPS